MAQGTQNNLSFRESISYKKIPFFDGGVEMMRAHFVSQHFSKHMHEDYALGIIENGAMGFRYRGSDLVASKGAINLVVPGEVHDGHAASDGGWAYRMFYLHPDVLLSAAREISEKKGVPHFREGVLDDELLAREILQVHRTIADNGSSSLEKETLLLRLLISWISRHADERTDLPTVGNEHRAVALARDYMEDSYGDDLSLESLADLCSLSRFHFVRVFEKEFGITPHAYLLQARVNRAKSMLSSSMRLADIAACCGFSDQSHLTRYFRRQFGITPGRYRNIIQNR